MKNKLSVSLLESGISSTINWFARNRVLGFLLVWAYKTYYKINTQEMLKPWYSFRTLSEFFTRPINLEDFRDKPQLNQFCSPCDGTVSAMGQIKDVDTLVVKQVGFKPSQLAGKFFDAVQDGSFLSIYLAPSQYHRVHLPMKLKLVDQEYIPGRIRSVKPSLFGKHPFLLSENERRVFKFETDAGKTVVMVLIGAFIVKSIETLWNEQEARLGLDVGSEMAQFNFGSSIVIMAEPEVLKVENSQTPFPVQVHQPIVGL